jgi:hypothetical protein
MVLDSGSVERDLEELRRIIDQKWMLSNSTSADYVGAIAAIRAKERLTTAEFALELQRLLALSADGHAKSASMFPAMKHISGRQLPFTLETAGNRFVAIDPSSSRRNQLWKPNHPYLVSIDGISVERWVASAMPLVPRSHPLSMKSQACNLIRFAGYFRTRLGIGDTPTFAVELESTDGKRISVVLDDSGTKRESLLKYNNFLRAQEPWRITDSNLGHISLAGAPDELGKRLAEAMPKLRGTRGLVLDLRRNHGGGAGETLNLLGIWFSGGQAPRYIAGIERRAKGYPLSANFHSVDGTSTELSPDGRQWVTDWLHRFRTGWTPPSTIPTTDRCVLLAPSSIEPGIWPYSVPEIGKFFPPESIFHYGQPVVVLVDRHCFSAAELMAAGLQGLPNITVVGERTRGGAGSPEFFRLPASGLEISLTTKTVYLPPNGQPIDGSGVIPDVNADLDLETLTGPRDTMFDRAVQEVEWILVQTRFK